MLKKTAAIALTSLFALGLSACDVDQTKEGSASLPKYEVEKTQEGNVSMPQYDVKTPDVTVSKQEKTVDVPTIETEKKTVEVPDVDVNAPKDK